MNLSVKRYIMDNMEQETDITLEHSTQTEKEIQENLNRYYNDYNVEEITMRLAELDEEWDIERVLQLKGNTLTITGIILGLTLNKKWLILPLVTSLVLINAIVRNRNPFPILRKFGFR